MLASPDSKHAPLSGQGHLRRLDKISTILVGAPLEAVPESKIGSLREVKTHVWKSGERQSPT